MIRRPWRDLRVWFLVAVAAVVTGAFLVTDGLSDEPRKDERLNWPTSLLFADSIGVTVDQLRSSHAPSGPLPFWTWGQLERLTGHGLVAGRILNAVLTVAMVALIVFAAGAPRTGIMAGVGLLVCPYFVGVGVHLYSDPATLFLVVAGMSAWRLGRHAPAAIALALAIACRQFAVAIPAALAVFEFVRWLQTGRRLALSAVLPWVAPGLACATLLGWIMIWGGLAPPTSVERYDVWTASVWRLVPRNALYALTCIGAYFVLVEMLLFRRRRLARDARSVVAITSACLLVVLFLLFPPLRNTEYAVEVMGYVDRAARMVLPDVPRMIALWALAALVFARFRPNSIAWVLIVFHVLVMLKSQVGWDKYNLLLLAVLWFLASARRMDDALIVATAAASTDSAPVTPQRARQDSNLRPLV